MRALRRSISTTPLISSQYPQLRAFFGLGKRRGVSQGLVGVTSASTQPHIPEFTHPTSSECTICRSESGDSEMALKVPTDACTHPPQVCIGCLQQVILAAITSGDFIIGIICPSSGCPQRLGYHDVKKYAAQKVFDRYDNLLMRDSLRANENYVFCVKSGCTAGQEHTRGENNDIVICHQCGTKQCFRHRTLWHEGLTCEQWDEQQRAIAKQQEQKTEDWIQTGTKPCPGPGCGRRIQKSDGCDHLICKRPGGCGHQFCWECLAPWLLIISNDNSKHYDSCKYYSGRPGKNPAPPEVVAARTVRARPAPSTPPLPASPVVANPTPRPLCELLLPHAIQQPELVIQPVRSGERTIEIPTQALLPPATPDAPQAGPSTKPSGSSRLSIEAEYGRPNQGSSLSVPPKGPTPTPCGPVAGPSTNQRPPIAMPLALGDSYDLHITSAFTGNLDEYDAVRRQRKNAEAPKYYRDRKMAYETGLVSTVLSLQERINMLEAQLAHDRKKHNPASRLLNLAWPDQLPPYHQNLHLVDQTAAFTQPDSHDFGALEARFMQSSSAADALFLGPYNVTNDPLPI